MTYKKQKTSSNEKLEKENQEMKALLHQYSLKRNLREIEDYRYQRLLAIQNLRDMMDKRGKQIITELNQIAIQLEEIKEGKSKNSVTTEQDDENKSDESLDTKEIEKESNKKKKKYLEDDDDDLDDDDLDDDDDDDDLEDDDD